MKPAWLRKMKVRFEKRGRLLEATAAKAREDAAEKVGRCVHQQASRRLPHDRRCQHPRPAARCVARHPTPAAVHDDSMDTPDARDVQKRRFGLESPQRQWRNSSRAKSRQPDQTKMIAKDEMRAKSHVSEPQTPVDVHLALGDCPAEARACAQRHRKRERSRCARRLAEQKIKTTLDAKTTRRLSRYLKCGRFHEKRSSLVDKAAEIMRWRNAAERKACAVASWCVMGSSLNECEF